MLPWYTWITALPLPQHCSVILLISYLKLFVSSCQLILCFLCLILHFVLFIFLFAFFQGSVLPWQQDGWGSRQGKKRAILPLLLGGMLALCCAWSAGMLEMWLSPSPSWPLSAQLEQRRCPTAELPLSKLWHLSLANCLGKGCSGSWRQSQVLCQLLLLSALEIVHKTVPISVLWCYVTKFIVYASQMPWWWVLEK